MPAAKRSPRPRGSSKSKSRSRSKQKNLLRSLPSWVNSKFTALLVVLAVLILGGVTYKLLNSQAASNRSGLPWVSGAYVGDWNAATYDDFGKWRNGKPLDVAVTWPTREHWDQFISPNPNYDAFNNKGIMPAFGVPPIPSKDGASVGACANGDYNDKWRTFGNTMKNINGGSMYVRLGWEFNGDWYVWGKQNPATFARCWDQIVGTVKPIAPGIKWVWNVNRGKSNGMADPTQAWPTSSNVDVVGVDSYNRYGSFNDQINGEQGMQYWLNWARSHGKKFSVGEWGTTVEPGNNGDQADYVNAYVNFFKANAADIAFEAYFNCPEDYNRGAIYNPNLQPNTSARYKQLYQAATGTVAPPAATPVPTVVQPGTSTDQIEQKGNLLVGINREFKSSVLASTSEPNHPIEMTTDQDETSRWISQPVSGYNITTDLGANYNLSSVKILAAADTTKTYQVQVSSDNVTFTNASTVVTSDGTSPKQLLTIPTTTGTHTGRYVRIVGTGLWNPSYGNSIWEIGLYGTLVGTAPVVTPKPAVTVTPRPAVTPMPTPTPVPFFSGPISGIGGKCIANKGGADVSNNPVVLYTCNGSGAENWWVSKAPSQPIRLVGYQWCIQPSGTARGSALVIRTCDAANAYQKWTYNTTTKRFYNPRTAMYLDDDHSITTNNNKLQIWTPGVVQPNKAQVWYPNF